MNRIILKSDDGSAQAAAGGHFVACLELVEHGLPFFLAALLGQNQEKVKDTENKNKRGDTEPPHTAATGLHCH
jgi:hypothetical protein